MYCTKEIIPFAFGDNLVRVHRDENGEPWWVAKDVCIILGLDNNRQAVSNLDDDEKITVSISDGNPRAGQPHQLTFVNEPGLYSLVFRSRKPEAREFKRWVTHEVLPSIRKTGQYTHPKATPAPPPEPAPAPELPRLTWEEMPDDVRRIKPRVRERCMDLALQTCRITGVTDREHLLATFVDYCKVIGGPSWDFDTLSYDSRSKCIAEYVSTCLMEAPGNRLSAGEIYQHFMRWWNAHYAEKSTPRIKSLASVLKLRYRSFKASTMFYQDVAFAATN